MVTRDWIRWVAMHGAPRAFLSVQARRGDRLARFLLGPTGWFDRYRLIGEIAERGRLVRTPFVWVSGDHEISRHILRDSRFGVSNPVSTGLPQPLPALMRWADPGLPNPAEPPSMLMVDGVDHDRYRRLVAQSFTPRAIDQLSTRVRDITTELLDDIEAASHTDLVADFAARLPTIVIAELLGLPESAHPRMLEWGDAAAPLLDIGITWPRFRRAMNGLRHLDGFLRAHTEQLSSAGPSSTPFAQLAGGRDMTYRELSANAALLIDAGFETTVNLIGNGIVKILEHPEELARLREDPTLWPAAIEEILRVESPVQMTVRTAHCDVDIDGQQIAAGEMLVLLLGGANRDPRVFTDPEKFDITRHNARDHVAFGTGSHACLGAALARVEGVTALRGLFERFPNLELTSPPEPRSSVTLHGYRRLPAGLGHRGRN